MGSLIVAVFDIIRLILSAARQAAVDDGNRQPAPSYTPVLALIHLSFQLLGQFWSVVPNASSRVSRGW